MREYTDTSEAPVTLDTAGDPATVRPGAPTRTAPSGPAPWRRLAEAITAAHRNGVPF